MEHMHEYSHLEHTVPDYTVCVDGKVFKY